MPGPAGPAGPAGPRDPPRARGEEAPVCSARGCRTPARWALGWNNPKLHPPERRKTWLACDEHREHLSGFLLVRGFLRETRALDQPGQLG